MLNRPLRLSALALALAAIGTVSVGTITAPRVLANVDHASSDAYLEKAKQYFQAGQLREASIELKNALRSSPDNAQARMMLGKIALMGNDLRGAEKEIRRAAEIAPSDEADVLLGEIHLQEGNAKLALEAVSRSSQTGQMQVEKLVIAGAALMTLERYKDAELRFREVLEIDNTRVEGHFGLARVFAATKDYSAANRTIDAILADKPDYSPAWLLRGELSMASGGHNAAFQAFTKAVELNPYDINPLISRARAHLAAGDIAGAKVDANALERMAGDAPITHYINAAIAFAEGDSDGANRSFTQLQRAFDEFPPAVLLGALIKNQRGELSQANSLLQRYIQMEPGNLDALRALAGIRLKMGQPSSAADILEDVISRTPADVTSLRQLASAYLALDRVDAAGRIYEQMVAAGGGGSDVAFAETALGMLDPTLTASGSELSDPRMRIAVLKASDAIMSGNLDQAQTVIDRIESSAPDTASVLALKGGLAGARGDKPAARKHLDAALARNPELIAALQASEALDRQAGDETASADRLRRLLQQKPASEMLTLRLARTLSTTGKQSEALDMLRQQARVLPNSEIIQRALISGLLVTNADAEAAQVAAKMARIPNVSTPTMVFAATALMDAGAADQAVPVAEALTRALPDSPRAVTLYAEALADSGRLDDAYAVLTQGAKRWPNDTGIAGTHVNLAVAAKDAEQARAAADRFAQNDPAGGSRMRARALGALGQPAMAVEVLEAAFARTPDGRLATELFTSRRRAGRDEAAFAGLNEWLGRKPDDRSALMTLATGYMESGQNQRAEGVYARFLELEPQNPVALNNYAWLRHKAGWGDALDYAERAYTAAPGSPEIADTYGWMLVQYGRLQQGLALLEQAAKASPDNPEIGYHLAYALSQSGRIAEAREALTVTLDTSRAFEARTEAEALLATLR